MFATKLKNQLLLITILPLLMTIAVVSLFILFEVLDDIETEVVKRAESIASQAFVMAEFPLYTGDSDALQKVASIMLKTHELAYIRFLDSTGQVLTHQAAEKGSGHLREFSFPVKREIPNLDDFPSSKISLSSTEALGTLAIGFTDNSAETQRFHAYIKVLGIALVALAIGILFGYLFSRRLTNAISSLINTAQQLEKKNFSTRSEENGSGELLNFQRTFNTMIDSLQQNDAELQEKIAAATASLNYTVNQLSEKNTALAQQREETIELTRSKAILEERERIMRDMHDGIGGQLVASLALLEKEQDSEVKRNIYAVLSECLDDLRLIIHSLSMQNSVLSSLLADFKYRTSRKLEQLDIQLDWQVAKEADDVRITPQTGLHLLRILQEAFTNILKHAKADQIRFHAEYKHHGFEIMIENNGRIAPDFDASHGHGISNMKSRAKKLGGRLNIEQLPTIGCRVVLYLPLSPPPTKG